MRQYSISDNEYNKLLLHIDKTLKHDAELIKIYTRLIEGLKSYEGRVLNTRIEKPIQAILNEYKVHYGKRYDHYYIYINRDQKQFEISLVGYVKEKNYKFTLDHMKETLKTTKEKHEKEKNKAEQVTEIVGKYNAALRWYRAAEKDLQELPGWFGFNRF